MDAVNLIRKIKVQQDLDIQGCADLLKIQKYIKDLEVSLSDCVSKLDSQIRRNPDLPKAYTDITKTAFKLLSDVNV